MSMNSYTVTATVDGQIVLPAELRRKFGIHGGTDILIEDAGDRIVLRPINAALVERLRGSMAGLGVMEELMKGREWERRR
jgi:AbrB family looped-hinge helix DNA binding protein